MLPETVVALHPPFAWLVDWTALAKAHGQRVVLVTNEASRARLMREGRAAGLAALHVPSDWAPEALEALVAPYVERPAGTRILSMIEPMQVPCAGLRERLGVPGPSLSIATTFTNKLAMKAAMRGVEDLLPRYCAFDPARFAAGEQEYAEAVAAELGLPIFVKPVAENSSLDTRRIDDVGALVAHLRSARTDLELDEYVEGEGFHLDAVIAGGQQLWFGAGRYLAPQGRTLAGAPLAGEVYRPDDPMFAELDTIHTRLLRSFEHVPDGCTHMEVLRRPDGRWVFLELAARVPGARVVEAYEVTRGVNLRNIHYALLMGHRVDLQRPHGRPAGYYCPMKTEPGRVSRLNPPPFTCEHWGEWAGDAASRTGVARTMSMADCLGFFVLADDDPAVLRENLDRTWRFRAYETEPLAAPEEH